MSSFLFKNSVPTMHQWQMLHHHHHRHQSHFQYSTSSLHHHHQTGKHKHITLQQRQIPKPWSADQYGAAQKNQNHIYGPRAIVWCRQPRNQPRVGAQALVHGQWRSREETAVSSKIFAFSRSLTVTLLIAPCVRTHFSAPPQEIRPCRCCLIPKLSPPLFPTVTTPLCLTDCLSQSSH